MIFTDLNFTTLENLQSCLRIRAVFLHTGYSKKKKWNQCEKLNKPIDTQARKKANTNENHLPFPFTKNTLPVFYFFLFFLDQHLQITCTKPLTHMWLQSCKHQHTDKTPPLFDFFFLHINASVHWNSFKFHPDSIKSLKNRLWSLAGFRCIQSTQLLLYDGHGTDFYARGEY